LPDFSLYQIPEWGKIDEMTTKHNKWHWNISNGRKMDLMSIKYSSILYWKTLQNVPKLLFLVWK
jgi:hypothetical protein